MTYICLIRVISGFFDNMYIVGKIYMFELTDKQRIRIIGFTIKGIMMLMGIYAGPWIGYHVYNYTNRDFTLCC